MNGTLKNQYPELEVLHQEFLRALSADPAPERDAAYFWYQAIQFDRDAQNPSATTRGQDELRYVNGFEQGGIVPGQSFAAGQNPKDVCSALISKNAADWEGPYQINFRYDRNADGVWAGSYSIETSAKHRDIVAGRAKYDQAIGAALKANWDAQATACRLASVVWKDRQAISVVIRRESGPADYRELDASMQQAWDALVAYLQSHGVRHIYHVNYALAKPTARLRDGDNVKLTYSLA